MMLPIHGQQMRVHMGHPLRGSDHARSTVVLVLGAILMVPLFGLVRRLGKDWWVWGAVLTIVFLAFVLLIAPVYISPLFNQYKKLEDAHIKDPILRMARANGIPAKDVYQFDESRQSNRVSANVSGFAGGSPDLLCDRRVRSGVHDPHRPS